MRMGFVGVGGILLLWLAVLFLLGRKASVPFPTPYWEIFVAAVFLLKTYRAPTRDRFGALAFCGGLLLLSPTAARQLPLVAHVTILVALGLYSIVSDLRTAGSHSHQRGVNRRKSILLPTILLVVLAAVAYFVLPYMFG
jgi:hypothetical protein